MIDIKGFQKKFTLENPKQDSLNLLSPVRNASGEKAS